MDWESVFYIAFSFATKKMNYPVCVANKKNKGLGSEGEG